jgi:hypothetical protein
MALVIVSTVFLAEVVDGPWSSEEKGHKAAHEG